MAFNVEDITGYVQQNEKQLIAKAMLTGKTAQLVSFQEGVKGSAQLNTLVANATLQPGGCNGFTPLGETVLSKREIKTGMIKLNEKFCDTDLIGTHAEWGTKIAVGKTDFAWKEYIAENKVKSVAERVDYLLWNADSDASGNTGLDLGQFDGLVKIINAEATVVDATSSGSTSLIANPIDAINLIVKNIPNVVINASDLTIFTGYDVVRAYVAAYNASNLFAGTLMLDGETMTLTIPNTNIKMVGVYGLTGKNYAVATPASNIVVGGDIKGAQSQYEFFYAQEAREFRLILEFNTGVQVYFPSYIVKYTK